MAGFGFVRFADRGDQGQALQTMNGVGGLGEKLLKVDTASPKVRQVWQAVLG